MTTSSTVTVEIIRQEIDATFYCDAATFDGKDRRHKAERWARTTLTEQRAATEYPDDLYAYFSDDLQGSFGEPDNRVGYAYLYHPAESIKWEDEAY